jgi:hypothetical protein
MTRVAELRTWVTDGSYHAISGGDYAQRGGEDSVLVEAREAGQYYSEAATSVFENTEEKVVKMLSKFARKLDSALGSLASTD